MPYLSEFCLFIAGFLAAFVFGDELLARLLRAWRRRRG
jgi:hypothetical protein